MRGLYLIGFFLLLFMACKEFKHYQNDYTQNDEDIIKGKIAHFGDYSLNNNDVKLIKFNNYYIGYAKYQSDCYFISYILNDKQVKLCRVFSKNWDKNRKINSDIIKANESLRKISLEFDTIYGEQDNGLIGVDIVDYKGNSVSNWNVPKIINITEFNKYMLVKCFIDSCPQILIK